VLIGLGLSWFQKSVDAAGRTAPDALAGEGGAYDIQ
jgi:hypothetical protein